MSNPDDENSEDESPQDASSAPPSPSPGGLGRRFLVGTAQLGVGTTAASLVNVAIGVLLARILGPEEFGLFAFAFVIAELIGIGGRLKTHHLFRFGSDNSLGVRKRLLNPGDCLFDLVAPSQLHLDLSQLTDFIHDLG